MFAFRQVDDLGRWLCRLRSCERNGSQTPVRVTGCAHIAGREAVLHSDTIAQHAALATISARISGPRPALSPAQAPPLANPSQTPLIAGVSEKLCYRESRAFLRRVFHAEAIRPTFSQRGGKATPARRAAYSQPRPASTILTPFRVP